MAGKVPMSTGQASGWLGNAGKALNAGNQVASLLGGQSVGANAGASANLGLGGSLLGWRANRIIGSNSANSTITQSNTFSGKLLQLFVYLALVAATLAIQCTAGVKVLSYKYHTTQTWHLQKCLNCVQQALRKRAVSRRNRLPLSFTRFICWILIPKAKLSFLRLSHGSKRVKHLLQ